MNPTVQQADSIHHCSLMPMPAPVYTIQTFDLAEEITEHKVVIKTNMPRVCFGRCKDLLVIQNVPTSLFAKTVTVEP